MAFRAYVVQSIDPLRGINRCIVVKSDDCLISEFGSGRKNFRHYCEKDASLALRCVDVGGQKADKGILGRVTGPRVERGETPEELAGPKIEAGLDVNQKVGRWSQVDNRGEGMCSWWWGYHLVAKLDRTKRQGRQVVICRI